MEQLNWSVRLKGLRHGDRVDVAHHLSKVDVWTAVAVESAPSWLRDMAAKLEAGFRASSATTTAAHNREIGASYDSHDGQTYNLISNNCKAAAGAVDPNGVTSTRVFEIVPDPMP